MKRRLLRLALVLALLVALELWLGRALASREPLQALLTGKLWVAGLALAVLGLRVFLLFVAPAWLAATTVEGWLESRASRPKRPRSS